MFERWNDRGSRKTGKVFSQPVRCGAKRLQLLALHLYPLPLSLLSSLSLSSRTDRGGRSQSAHTLQLASITWSPQIPKLVERRKSSKSFTGPRSVTE